VNCVLFAFFAHFLERQFFLDFFLVSLCEIIYAFARIASHFHQIFSRHKIFSLLIKLSRCPDLNRRPTPSFAPLFSFLSLLED